MRKLFARLGVAALVVLCSARAEAANDVLKPFVVMILDTSGSMDQATNSGPPSCGSTDTKLNHARCAIGEIVNSFGDIVFAFGRFREVAGGTFNGTCDEATTTCTLTQDACTAQDDRFELMTALVDGGNAATATWVNFTCNGCLSSATDPEIWGAGGSTPIEGSLKGAKRYWQGLQATPFTIAASPTGATEAGTTATYTTTVAHGLTTLSVGTQIIVAGVGVAGYNGTFTVTGVPSATKLTVTLPTSGLAASGGGTLAVLIWPAAQPGFNPIFNDPTNAIFFPNGCDPSSSCSGANCCTNQCRPYITILLTDGDETCGGNPPAGAAAMLKTAVASKNYRVETKPIGFGITAPTPANCDGSVFGDGKTGCQIEQIAHAGGAIDVPGKNEGFYAADQAGVELAVSQIIAGASRAELCNGLDDDCDGIIDEDFPNKNKPCNNGLQGVCAVNGTLVCKADGSGLTCNAGAAACNAKPNGAACNVTNTSGTSVPGTCQAGDCVPTPGVEICNGIDDDCDGLIDEGLSCQGCIPQPEQCNGKDDDCDGTIDEDTDVPCGINVGVCTTGVQHCVGGVLQPCTGNPPCNGVTPCVETCNKKDDDCDGVVDGLQQACSTLSGGFPAGDPRNNPGDPNSGKACATEAPGVCACHPGEQTCPPPPTGNGTFGPCQGEIKPGPTDPCDGIDNDCDGIVDEDFVPAACGGCGGVTVCINGQIQCTTGTGTTEICNGIDDDCDGSIDEGFVDGQPCVDANGTNVTCGDPCNSTSTCGGKLECVQGAIQCTGGTSVGTESCNCVDDDCDGKIDEDNGNCPGGSTCTNTGSSCECAFPCMGGEFPCPLGKVCTGGFCVTDPCFNVTCPQSPNAEVCVNGVCQVTCDTKSCKANEVCVHTTGECVTNDCSCNAPECTMQCKSSEVCIAGVCMGNPCDGVQCDASIGQYCENGQCVGTCAGKDCPTGERCRLGMCETDPCGKPCPFGEVCDDASGQCINNPCGFTCPTGQYCDPNGGGICKTDPCVGTMCPSPDQVCLGGTCDLPPAGPDAGTVQLVTTGGGGCSTTGGGSVLVGFALLLVLRRRRS